MDSSASSRTVLRPMANLINTPSMKQSICALCTSGHFQYPAKRSFQRRQSAMLKGLCFGTMGPHLLKNCHTPDRCGICQKHHHTSSNLAKSVSFSFSSSNSKHISGIPERELTVLNASRPLCSSSRPNIIRRTPVLLATALIIVVSENGEHFHARALLDQGSEVSFITELLAEMLGLTRRFSAVPIIGIGAQRSDVARGATSFQLVSRVESFTCHVDALILPELTTSLPAAPIFRTQWSHLEGLSLADPDFAKPSKIDVILGARVYSQIIRKGLRRGSGGAPIAQQTYLGWVLSGPIDATLMESVRLDESSVHELQYSPDYKSLEKAMTCDQQPISKESHLGVLLNRGPKLRMNLTNILVRWRWYANAVSTDIEAIYHQMRDKEDGRPLQQTLWRENDANVSDSFQPYIVMYGLANTSYMARRTLQQFKENVDLEERNVKCSTITINCTSVVRDLVQRYSSLTKLLRITAWCGRVGNRFRRLLS
ncbi:uncharacterized protein LOC114880108 [Osmia bicornis bicornis]|uniref:uncharacterized protein LOC114880108 n=1 Tax=Osmia bicornis bicornis TaxID=1437191 RepID=UPI001EAEC2B7|nr:uncharacterized protein LOC114880108 [Osmia bicornis bicornis]